jgi:hypothetical protein
VILVAVAIVIAIAVAFWASGLVGVFTRFEKLEIVSAIMTDERTFTVRIRNTGSADSAIVQVVVQGRGIGTPADGPVPIRVGETLECTVTVASPPPGITVELAFYSAGGKTYPTAVLATLGFRASRSLHEVRETGNCVSDYDGRKNIYSKDKKHGIG